MMQTKETGWSIQQTPMQRACPIPEHSVHARSEIKNAIRKEEDRKDQFQRVRVHMTRAKQTSNTNSICRIDRKQTNKQQTLRKRRKEGARRCKSLMCASKHIGESRGRRTSQPCRTPAKACWPC
jgi:hypothetical protein